MKNDKKNKREQEIKLNCKLFKNTEGEIVITSLELSKLLNQNHRDILRNIRNWLEALSELKSFSYKDDSGKENICYELNKYQFMLYATHIKGFDELKVQIIKDYEAMEKFIQDSKLTEEFKYYRETGKIARRNLTDTIKDKLQPSNNFVYRNYTELAYLKAFGKKTKELKLERNLGIKDSLRDNLSPDELKVVLEAEEFIKSSIIVFTAMKIDKKEIFKKIKELVLNS